MEAILGIIAGGILSGMVGIILQIREHRKERLFREYEYIQRAKERFSAISIRRDPKNPKMNQLVDNFLDAWQEKMKIVNSIIHVLPEALEDEIKEVQELVGQGVVAADQGQPISNEFGQVVFDRARGVEKKSLHEINNKLRAIYKELYGNKWI